MANIVITGASRGIAYELAKQCGAAGDRVFATCRDPATADALKALADGSNGRITVHQLDVARDDSVRDAVADTGSDRIDVIYNVAGVLGQTKPELELGSSDWAGWQDVLNIMTFGPLRVLQGFLPRMDAGSKVINITSQLAASTWPYGGFYPYVAAKAALNRVMRAVAVDLKPRGIIVGIVHPGYVKTDMSGPKADITPEESAAGVRKVTDGWTLDQTGAFMKWNGQAHPW